MAANRELLWTDTGAKAHEAFAPFLRKSSLSH